MRIGALSGLFCLFVLCVIGCGGGGGGGGIIVSWYHSPAHKAADVPVTTDLIWGPVKNAVSYDVYLGTDETLVENATTVDAEFMGNQTTLFYDPAGNLVYDTTYYWRIDVLKPAKTVEGKVWRFTTESAPATLPAVVEDPDPADGAGNVPVDQVLAWGAAIGAVSYDVYLGTDQTAVTNATTASGEFMGNQSGVSYVPTALDFTTTYYWRIDSRNGIGVTAGDVWSFTTTSLPPLPEVYHSGTISSDTTWTSDVLHIVDGDVYVEGAGSATLTIEAGTFIVFDRHCFLYVGYNQPGGLRAIGDASNRISFSANSPSPTKGFWGGIYFYDQAYDYDGNPGTGCIMDYCNVAWAGDNSGWGRGDGAILVEGLTSGPSVRVFNCSISNSGAHGILMADGGMFGTGSSGNTITSCDTYPVGIDANEAGTVRAGTYTGNTIDAIEIDSYWPVDTTATWVNPGVPYVITWDDLTIEGASSPVLTIQPGTTLKFDSGCGVLVGWGDTGTLIANGSSGQEITFTANSPSPTKGFWVGVVFDELSVDYANPSTGCQMDYCIVEYAGGDSGWGEGDGAILVEGADPDGPSVKVSNCQISNSAAHGILLGWGGSFGAGSTGNTITTCDSYPVGIDAHKAHTLAAGTYTGNTIDRIRIEPWYSVDTTCTWVDPGVPYEITGISSLRVEGAASPTLTIASGSTLVFDSQLAFDVGWGDAGGLSADGVTFTGRTATNSYWEGINFYSYTITSVVNNCTVEYGGYDGSEYDGNIIIHDDAGTASIVTITNCDIQHTNGWGIVRYWDSGTYGTKDFTPTNTFTDCTRGSQSTPW
jgi:hypothetical protein